MKSLMKKSSHEPDADVVRERPSPEVRAMLSKREASRI
jgi:hypothetical protein